MSYCVLGQGRVENSSIPVDVLKFLNRAEGKRSESDAEVRNAFTYFHATTSKQFCTLQCDLSRVVPPLRPTTAQAPEGMLPKLHWALVLLHLQEAKESINTLGVGAISKIINADPAKFQPGVEQKAQALRLGMSPGESHMLQLLRTALKHVTEADRPRQPEQAPAVASMTCKCSGNCCPPGVARMCPGRCPPTRCPNLATRNLMGSKRPPPLCAICCCRAKGCCYPRRRGDFCVRHSYREGRNRGWIRL